MANGVAIIMKIMAAKAEIMKWRNGENGSIAI
jgi:hypothetical protein